MPLVKIMSKDGYRVVELNRRRAIRERCLNCSGWYTAEVRNCSFTDCPLYPFRSGKGPQDSRLRKKAIHDYCLWCVGGSKYEIAKCAARACPLFVFRTGRVDHSVVVPDTSQNGADFPKKDHIEASDGTNSV